MGAVSGTSTPSPYATQLENIKQQALAIQAQIRDPNRDRGLTPNVSTPNDPRVPTVEDPTKKLESQYQSLLGLSPEESKLKQITHELMLDKRVVFLGRKKLNEVHQYLKAADAYILNSKYESYANTALEAMAIGTPVFLSRVEGSEDLIIHGKTGHFFTHNNPSEIATQLKHIENKILMVQTTEAAKKAVNTWENVFLRTKAILEKITT